MNKGLKSYIICWIILVVLFNIICFISPNEMWEYEKFGGAFWAGYGFIMGSYILHLVYAIFALTETNKEKRVLNVPVVTISFIELFIMVIAGTVCMFTPNLPNWLGILICFAVLAFSVIMLVLTRSVGENAQKANEQLNASTDMMRELSGSAQLILSRAKSEEAKQAASKVYDALRFSDLVSSEATAQMEDEIKNKLQWFSDSVRDGEAIEVINVKMDELLQLVEKRNIICRDNKRQKK